MGFFSVCLTFGSFTKFGKPEPYFSQLLIRVCSFGFSFQVKKKQFFKNFTIILLFGVLGTVISFCLISLGNFYNSHPLPLMCFVKFSADFCSIEPFYWFYIFCVIMKQSIDTIFLLLSGKCIGASLLFRRIGISTLNVQDYLGDIIMFESVLSIWMGPLTFYRWLLVSICTAVGAILSATDSVCTLQVKLIALSKYKVVNIFNKSFCCLIIFSC